MRLPKNLNCVIHGLTKFLNRDRELTDQTAPKQIHWHDDVLHTFIILSRRGNAMIACVSIGTATVPLDTAVNVAFPASPALLAYPSIGSNGSS